MKKPSIYSRLLLFLIILLSSLSTQASNYTWNGAGVSGGSGGTDFNAAANWLDNGIAAGTGPGAGDDVTMTLTSSATITLSADTHIKTLTCSVSGSGSVFLLSVANFELFITQASSFDATSGNTSTKMQLNVGNANNSTGNFLFGGDVTVAASSTQDVVFRGFSGSNGYYEFRKDLTLSNVHATTDGAANFPDKYIFTGGTQIYTNNAATLFKMTNVEVGTGASATTLTLAGTSSATLTATATHGANLSVLAGATLDLGTLAMNRSAAGGTLAVQSGSSLLLAGNSGGQTGSNFPLNFTTMTLDANSTVNYNGVVTQTVFGTPTYGHLSFTNNSTKNAGAAITAAGNITINATATFDVTASNFGVTLAGNWVNNGTFTPRSGTVTFNKASGTQTLNSGGVGAGKPFNNLLHNAAGTLQLITNSLAVSGTFTNSAGTFDANSLVNTVTGLATISGGTYTASTSTQNFNGGLTVSGGIFTGSTGTVTATNVTLSSGTLTAPNASGTFTVSGNWTNNGGTFTHNSGTVTFNGVAQTISGTGTTPFYDLTIGSITINSGTSTVEDALDFSGTGRSFTNSGNFALLSTATKTARVAPVNILNTIAGNITVHRFIPAHRAWRLLAPPLNTTLQTINAAWQEGQTNTTITNSNTVPGFGTHISGPQTGSGFDFTPHNNHSLKVFDNVNTNWNGIPNTNVLKLTDYPGYMLFVRGSRAVNLALNQYASADNTILRASGTLITGTKNFTINTAVGKFTVVGNPYASAVDFHSLGRTGGLGDKFSVWDPNLTGLNNVGGFVTYTWDNVSAYVPSVTPASAGLGRYIQSGQAMLIEGSGSSETLTFNEANKVTTSTSNIFAPQQQIPTVRIQLYGLNPDNTSVIVDGTVAIYNDSYSNDEDLTDAAKAMNINESIGLLRNNRLLAIEARKPLSGDDTLHVAVSQMFNQNYKFEISLQSFDDGMFTATLYDKFLNTSAPLDFNNTNWYNFTVSSNPGTDAADRFRIIFSPAAPLPLAFTQLSAYHEGQNIKVEWNVLNQTDVKNYQVETSLTGSAFKQVASVNSNNSTSYKWTDMNVTPGAHFYRIRGNKINGEINYSGIIKVVTPASKSNINVYPNPVAGGQIHVNFINVEKGVYNLKLLNASGQVLISRSVDHKGGTADILLNTNIAAGNYKLNVTGANSKFTISINAL